jgi:hypothetical protein
VQVDAVDAEVITKTATLQSTLDKLSQ